MAEVRSETIIGEGLPDRTWDMAFRVLGSLGIHRASEQSDIIEPVTEPTADFKTTDPSDQNTTIEAEIPRTLEEVVRADQFFGIEHMIQFWGSYKTQPAPFPSYTKSRTVPVNGGLNELVRFRTHHHRSRRHTEEHRQELREAAGLVIFDRVRGGKLTPARPIFMSMNGLLVNSPVVQVGGFIDFIVKYDHLEQQQKPKINPSAINFFKAFTAQLQEQIDKAALESQEYN